MPMATVARSWIPQYLIGKGSRERGTEGVGKEGGSERMERVGERGSGGKW